MKNSKHINMLIMPTEYCNMRCKYCFYQDREPTNFGNTMSFSVIEQIMRITMNGYDSVSFVWHGGEPLLMGLDFYKSVVEIQKLYSESSGVKVRNSIQSNLTMIDYEFAKFLVTNDFGIGGSFDGIKNDYTRGNSDRIIQGRQKILDAGGHCGMISVVSGLTIDTLIESYKYFNANKTNYSINPYIGNATELGFSHLDFTNSLIELFDYWAKDTQGSIIISYFERIINFLITKKKTVCTYSSCLGNWIAVDFNGDLKPCNRPFPDEYSYGNVFDYQYISEAFDSDGFVRLLTKAVERREKCKSCEIFAFCSGGCNYVAMMDTGIENNDGLHCESLRLIYKHIYNYLQNVKKIGLNNIKIINPQFAKILSKQFKK